VNLGKQMIGVFHPPTKAMSNGGTLIDEYTYVVLEECPQVFQRWRT
jgi:hypothetical protein